MQYVISFYSDCRMENRDHANEELMVVDECDEEASDAPFASAGNGLINFLLKFNKYR